MRRQLGPFFLVRDQGQTEFLLEDSFNTVFTNSIPECRFLKVNKSVENGTDNFIEDKTEELYFRN